MRIETVEKYLKALFHLSEKGSTVIGNKEIAAALNVKPTSVTEAMNNLSKMKLVQHEKSYGTRLSSKGSQLAMQVIRRHRLWETFLVRTLKFSWSEVHAMAEELEHVSNGRLIQRLAEHLGHPEFDPHGDPIPDTSGKMPEAVFTRLSDINEGVEYTLAAVMDDSGSFLEHLDTQGIGIGTNIKVVRHEPYDHSMKLRADGVQLVLTSAITEKLLMKRK